MMKRIFFPIMLFSLVFHLSCERMKKTEEQPLMPPTEGKTDTAVKQQDGENNPSISMANIVLYPTGKEAVTLNIEVARTPEERRQGLQGRQSLATKQGMWFIFESYVQDPFWMKDTPVSLDILFFDKDYKTVDFVENAVPNSETLLVPRSKYRYALEVNAGSVRNFGLVLGDRAEFRLGPP